MQSNFCLSRVRKYFDFTFLFQLRSHSTSVLMFTIKVDLILSIVIYSVSMLGINKRILHHFLTISLAFNFSNHFPLAEVKGSFNFKFFIISFAGGNPISLQRVTINEGNNSKC